MSEETWHEARLIPTSGINGKQEQERRATSALLAVLGVVPEFSKSLLSKLGAPSGKAATYIEVPFEAGDSKFYPDGLIRVTRGQKEWTALVEVKTGKNFLEAGQLERYLDIARSQGFDALITISNELVSIPGHHPIQVDKRKLRKVAMHHWSWTYVLSAAIMQKEHRGIEDPEQAWILGELVRYLEHDRSGALQLDDMGQQWVGVRDAVHAGTLRSNDSYAPEIVSRFDALLRYASLALGQKLGADVTQHLSRAELADPGTRVTAMVGQLVEKGQLSGAVRIPHALGPLYLVADLRANKVTWYVDIQAPREGRAKTRVNWLVRQLKEAPGDLRIEVFQTRARGSVAAELLSAVREQPELLTGDPNREMKSFRVALSVPMGGKRGRGQGAFIDSVLDSLDRFYAEVVQGLKEWVAKPPRLREAEKGEPVPPQLVSTDLSSQDGPESA
ncbi:hypothetical protein [Aeromicrobium sp. CTD01-1L150]|uniref:hypothetical protein n=1 Tax=Aeromicrobium sp. CTD01-1L150 TaxID=3341830 RepID=UPI0035BECAB1